ncbi:MAG: glycosyltransferase family 2 protein [Candidatus Magasanikbacteria bacterium]|nr:glycosyltransferase family 2 protein [Candidatus Magasanikbacteria bacterium]
MIKPLVSVIMPAYNNAATIGTALDAMLAQTYQPLEIIVVDDMSDDGTADVVGRYRAAHPEVIRYLRVPYDDPYRYNERGININAGWLARNVGIAEARGELVTFQDADDGAAANRIEVQYELMQKYNSHHVVVDWQKFDPALNGKVFSVIPDAPTSRGDPGSSNLIPDNKIVSTKEIMRLVRKTRPRRFFRAWDAYPCAGSNPLVRREVFEKVRFRPLWERTRPSQKGRGADRDFNFWVAEEFGDSIAAKIPLVLWRVATQNPAYHAPLGQRTI